MAANTIRRVALVTGGSRGIGRATCLALAEAGRSVAVHYRERAEAAAEVVSQIREMGGQAVALQADLSDPGAAAELARQTVTQLGLIDILINNAGEMKGVSILEMTDEAWERSLSINLTATFRMVRASIPTMIERKWGRIVNVASQVVYTGSANNAHYAAAKSGLLGFTFSLAKELGTTGVTANIIAPGRIVTDMIIPNLAKREAEWLSQTPMKRFGQPEEVAAAIVFLASEQASYITGAILQVNGGLVMG